MREQIAVSERAIPLGWRPGLGLLLLILALVSPLLAPLALASDLPEAPRRALAGLLLFGVPMALIVVVMGLVGAPAYLFITSRVAGQGAGAVPVGVGRYRIGLVLLSLGVLVSWIEPLVSPGHPAVAARRVLIGTLADGVVLASLFVLGAGFWDKVHALFVREARVVAVPGRAIEPILVTWRFYTGVAVIVLSFGTRPQEPKDRTMTATPV